MSRGGTLRFDVGGLHYVVRSDTAPITADLEPTYSPFVTVGLARDEAAVEGDDAIIVDVRLDAPPPLNETSPLFESAPAWTMRSQGERRIFYHQDPRHDTPLLTMEFPIGLQQVTVWCDPEGWTPDVAERGILSPIRYPLDQILLMYTLARAGGLLIHSTAVVLGGRALVCCGVSGAGKTTLARQFLQSGSDLLLSDDRIIVRGSEHGWTAFGTPWAGDARVAVNAGVPLGALLFLRQSTRNHITPLTGSEALHRLLRVSSIPWFDAAVLPAVLGLCDELIAATPTFEFEFLPEPASADLLRAFAASEFTV